MRNRFRGPGNHDHPGVIRDLIGSEQIERGHRVIFALESALDLAQTLIAGVVRAVFPMPDQEIDRLRSWIDQMNQSACKLLFRDRGNGLLLIAHPDDYRAIASDVGTLRG